MRSVVKAEKLLKAVRVLRCFTNINKGSDADEVNLSSYCIMTSNLKGNHIKSKEKLKTKTLLI